MNMVSTSKSRAVNSLFYFSILAALIFTGCSSDEDQAPAPAEPSSSIQNINWQWVNVIDQSTGATTTVPNPGSYTVSFFSDGSLSGKADCNTFTGTYSQQNGFKIELGVTTMAFCGEDSLDQQYLNLLGSIAAGGPDGEGGLALETAGGAQRMTFENGGAATAP